MARRAAETNGTREEVTLYCPSRMLEPRQCLWAHLDPCLTGVRVMVVRPAEYEEGQPVSVHALPWSQENPLDNFNVLSPVPEWLRGHWTKAHQSPRWKGDTAGDIFLHKNRLQKLSLGIRPRCAITTYEYRAPRGLNHSLAKMHEVMAYLALPMLEDVVALLGDFVTLY